MLKFTHDWLKKAISDSSLNVLPGSIFEQFYCDLLSLQPSERGNTGSNSQDWHGIDIGAFLVKYLLVEKSMEQHKKISHRAEFS